MARNCVVTVDWSLYVVHSLSAGPEKGIRERGRLIAREGVGWYSKRDCSGERERERERERDIF